MATYRANQDLWEARRRLPNGKRRSFYAVTEREAEAVADAFIGRSSPSSTAATLNEFAKAAYVPTLLHHSLKYRRSVAWALDKHILPSLGRYPIVELKRENLQVFLIAKLEELSLKSVQTLRGTLYAIFALAEADDVIPKNPVRFVKLPPKRASTAPAPPSIEVLGAIIAASRGHALERTILLAAGLGLRRSEILALEPSDFRTDELLIDRQKVDGLVGPVKTRASKRRLLLPNGFADMVRDLPNSSDATLVRRGREVLPVSVTLHTLRHAFVTGIESLGCPRSVTAAILGHSGQSVTDLYARVDPEQIRFWLRRWLTRLLSYAQPVGVQPGEAKNGKTA